MHIIRSTTEGRGTENGAPATTGGTTERVLAALEPQEMGERTAQKLFEEIMAKNCPSLEKNINL